MPHVLVDGPVRTAEYAEAFKPSMEKMGEEIIRLLDVLLNRERNRALVETVVVESGRSVRFFIELRDRSGGVTVRLEPVTDPEKTPGVKRSVAIVAREVCSLSDACRYGRTNLDEFLPAEG